MTFKHVKFEDSAVMRSLEKLAREKGLVKDEPITKEASSNVYLSPTASLTERILRLCAGLRASGFDKHAADLEERFVVYKQAQTLYETTSEKGEDLVDAAHPKGSHKLENVEGDEAVFETIVDQHLKNMKMVEKTPTGKLASGRDVLNSVKIVLGQDTATLLENKMVAIRAKMSDVIAAIKSQPETADLTSTNKTGQLMALGGISRWTGQRPITVDTVNKLIQAIASCKSTLMYMDPDERTKLKEQYNNSWSTMAPNDRQRYVMAMQNYSAWQQASTALDAMTSMANETLNLTKGDFALQNKIQALAVRLSSYRSLLNDEGFTDDDRKQGNAFIDRWVASLNNMKKVFSGLDPDTKAQEAPRYESRLSQIEQAVNQFHEQLIA